MEKRLSSHDMAFDGHQDDSADAEELTHTPAAFLSQQDTDPAVVVEAHNEKSNSTSKLHTALQGLDERSREILAERWLSDKKSTLHELADKYSVSAERIRQLEKSAMNKVRQSLLEYRPAS